MVASVLDEVQFQSQVGANLTLNSCRPLLDIPQFQAMRIDGRHSPSREVGILAYVHCFPWIAAVPIKSRKGLIIQRKARIESVGHAAPGIQIQRNIKQAE